MASPVVEVAEGKVRGKILENLDGEEILTYLGIPFAKPPLGDLRFKNPEPAEPWDGVKDCTDDFHPCYQKDIMSGGQTIGSEDCLYLNVFTKSVTPDKPKPVFVFIHGGAFTMGSNQTKFYGPEFLLTEDLVLVTINYRLGILGFLRLDDPALEVPGNLGLKDQVFALKWIQKNISRFGGNPNNVTIAGESAGGVSVHYHVVSPASKGLFHKAIPQSGVTLNSWAQSKTKILDVLSAVGIDLKDEAEALVYLRNLPVEQVYQIQEKHALTTGEGIFWGPTIETPNPSAFISEHPLSLVSSGRYNKVPLILGYCNREGILWLFNKVMKSNKNTDTDQEEATLEQILGGSLKVSSDSDIIKDLARKIKKIYFSSGDLEQGRVLLYSDMFFIAGIVATAELHAATSPEPVYLYQFSIDAGLNVLKRVAQLKVPGACHGDDLGYIFKTAFLPRPEKGTLEEVSVRRFVKLLANFAKDANPTPPDSELGVTWQPAEKGSVNFLDIGESLTPGTDPEPERMALWREVKKILVEQQLRG